MVLAGGRTDGFSLSLPPIQVCKEKKCVEKRERTRNLGNPSQQIERVEKAEVKPKFILTQAWEEGEKKEGKSVFCRSKNEDKTSRLIWVLQQRKRECLDCLHKDAKKQNTKWMKYFRNKGFCVRCAKPAFVYLLQGLYHCYKYDCFVSID